ncbi:MAG: REP-associated tyrosine transposase [Thermodesulfobacteriota bacterium]|nr:REP-associated tyrosine transposase [Thermodesulfobacteriota bacterium]
MGRFVKGDVVVAPFPFRNSHKGWLEEGLRAGEKARAEEWTDSIVVRSEPFVEGVKGLIEFRAKGRRVIEAGEGYQVREGSAPYNALFGGEKEDIASENSYLWNVNPQKSTTYLGPTSG